MTEGDSGPRIAFCILGYYLDAGKLATATIFPCTAAIPPWRAPLVSTLQPF